MKYRRNFLQSILLYSFLITPLLMGCSGDDDDNAGGTTTSPYWVLGTDNTNMPSSGTLVAQYSDAPTGSDIGKLVDGDADTQYLTYHNVFYVTWNGNNNVAALSYSLTSAADSQEMDPKSWILYGSSDGSSWKELDTRENQVFSERKETVTYSIDNTVAYRYYRLSITANNGGSATQIAEWVLSAADTYDENINDLMSLASGDTSSDITVMGTQHENDLEASAADLVWLADPDEQPNTFDGLSWTTFSVTNLYPFSTPKPADINQHSIGDCSLLATLSSIAYLFPNYIKSIITDNGDKTYTVTLFDPKGEKVEVGVDTYFVGSGSTLNAVSGKNNNVTWATVIEKAVIKWYQVYRGSSNIGGIGTEMASAILVGNGSSFAFAANKLDASDLQRAVEVSLNQRKIVVGGFSTNGVTIDNKYNTVNAHAYSFHVSSNSNYLFAMRNPWGTASTANNYDASTEDGVMYIPDDNSVISLIDLRICDPGAAYAYATTGLVEPYTPPSYTPSPLRLAPNLLYTAE